MGETGRKPIRKKERKKENNFHRAGAVGDPRSEKKRGKGGRFWIVLTGRAAIRGSLVSENVSMGFTEETVAGRLPPSKMISELQKKGMKNGTVEARYLPLKEEENRRTGRS